MVADFANLECEALAKSVSGCKRSEQLESRNCDIKVRIFNEFLLVTVKIWNSYEFCKLTPYCLRIMIIENHHFQTSYLESHVRRKDESRKDEGTATGCTAL